MTDRPMYERGGPYRLAMKAGVEVCLCTCGATRAAPLCDGTHKSLPGVPYATLQEVFDELGPQDTSAIHSYAYRGLPGYYAALRNHP